MKNIILLFVVLCQSALLVYFASVYGLCAGLLALALIVLNAIQAALRQ